MLGRLIFRGGAGEASGPSMTLHHDSSRRGIFSLHSCQEIVLACASSRSSVSEEVGNASISFGLCC